MMLQKKNTAQEVWDALVDEMTKKPKMVVTSLQRQLQNIKCPEEDDLRLHLDRAQDLYARLREMGASISSDEFMYIILSSLPPWTLIVSLESLKLNMTNAKLYLHL